MSKPLDFGDYCWIEQKRFGVPNEMYQYKVIGRLRSNAWVDVPVGPPFPIEAKIHSDGPDLTPVLRCICCGIDETRVFSFREADCFRTQTGGGDSE